MYFASLQSLCERVCEVLGVGTEQLNRTTSPFSKARVIRHLNSAYSAMNEMAVNEKYSRLWRYANATLDLETRQLDLTWTGSLGRLMGIVRRRDATDTVLDYPEFLATYRQISAGGYRLMPQEYNIDNLSINILHSNWKYWRVYYLARFPDMSQGTFEAGSNTTITLPATPTIGETANVDDYYVNGVVRIISGTGVGQQAVVTDYDPATRVCTCSPLQLSGGDAFPTAPDNTSVYWFEPWFPVQYWETIALIAASKFTKFEQATLKSAELALALKEYRQFLQQEDLSSSSRVVDSGAVERYTGSPINANRRWGYIGWTS